jgi:hypothetical protein
MTKTTAIPATTNESWGFYGTMEEHAKAAWPMATRAIARATGIAIGEIQPFLDSRQGRHFADDVLNAMAVDARLGDAIDAAIERWMGWTISRDMQRDLGIPRGLPYLTGMVGHYAFMAEDAEA